MKCAFWLTTLIPIICIVGCASAARGEEANAWPDPDGEEYVDIGTVGEPSGAMVSMGMGLLFMCRDEPNGPVYWADIASKTLPLTWHSQSLPGLTDPEGLAILRSELTDRRRARRIGILDEGHGSAIPAKLHFWNYGSASIEASVTIGGTTEWRDFNSDDTYTLLNEDSSGFGPEGLAFVPDKVLPHGSQYGTEGLFYIVSRSQPRLIFVCDYDLDRTFDKVGVYVFDAGEIQGTPSSLEYDWHRNVLWMTTQSTTTPSNHSIYMIKAFDEKRPHVLYAAKGAWQTGSPTNLVREEAFAIVGGTGSWYTLRTVWLGHDNTPEAVFKFADFYVAPQPGE